MTSYYSVEEVANILGVKTNSTVYKTVNNNYIDDSIIREGRNYIISENWIRYYQEKILLKNACKIVYGVYGYFVGKTLLYNFYQLLNSSKNEFTIIFKNLKINVSLVKESKAIIDFNIKITNLCHNEFTDVSQTFKEMLLERLLLESHLKITTVTSFEIENAKFIMPPKTKIYDYHSFNNFKATVKYMGVIYTMDTVKELKEFLKQDFPYTK